MRHVSSCLGSAFTQLRNYGVQVGKFVNLGLVVGTGVNLLVEFIIEFQKRIFYYYDIQVRE